MSQSTPLEPPLTAAVDEGLLPIGNAGATAILDQLRASGAVEKGAVTIISLAAIAERLSDRWPARQERVQDHTEHTLERHLAGQGIFHRLSATDYLVWQPSLSAIAGQAASHNILRGILLRFLGAAVTSDIRLQLVTRITQHGVHVAPVDAASIESPWRDPHDHATDNSPARLSPFVATNGLKLRVSCVLEPIIRLNTSTRIGFRVVRRVLEMPSDRALTAAEVRNLSRTDIQRIDLATVERGLDRLRSDNRGAKCLSLMLPVSYVTLSNVDGRAAVISLFRQAQAAVRLGVIGEICDIDGVPPGALSAVVSLVKPFCLYVFGRMAVGASVTVQNLTEARLHAVTIECPSTLTAEADFIRWAREAAALAGPAAKSLLLCGLHSTRQMAVAGLVGASHATLRPLR